MSMKIIEQNSSDIDNLRNMVIDLSNNIATLVNDNKHMSEKLDDVLENIKRVSDHDYKLKQIDNLYTNLSKAIKKMEGKVKEFDDKFIVMDEISKRRQSVLAWFVKNWYKITPFALASIYAIAKGLEFLYHLDPRAKFF